MNLFELSAKISVDDSSFKKSMENVQKVSKNVATAIKNLQSPLDKAKSGFNAIAHPVETVKANIEKLKNATEAIRHPIETFKSKVADASTALETKRNKLSALAAGYDSAKKKVDDLTKEFNKSAKESGTSSQKTQELAKKLNEAEKEAEEAKKELDDYSASVSKAGKNSDSASKGIGNFASKLGKGIATAGKIGVAAVGAAAAAITALTTAAVNNYAEYEQLVGGVETLFGKSADTVMKYAENAYKTAGLSANEYMATVTSFSASLLQSVGGDTEKAADYANRALTDMSDNANKMGTSMELIQNAYNGFAKANYTMLDNLKLGYGGTKEEMARLIEEAAAMTDVQKELGIAVDATDMSFGNIVNAISVVQKNMKITGTTADEAGRTIAGSVQSMKSAWTNLVTGLADGNADIGQLVDNLVTTIVGDGTEENLGVFGNILPAVQTALTGASTLISELLPKIVQIIPAVITENLPILAEAAISIIQSLADGISQNQGALIATAFETIVFLVNSLISMLPQIVALGLELIVSLANGITESLPELIPTIVDVILQIVDTITDPETLSNLIDASLEIIVALADGLIACLPELLEKAPEIVQKLVNAVIENAPKLLDSAYEIIVKLVEGIVENLPQLLESGTEIVFSILEGITDLLGDLIMKGKDIVDSVKEGFSSKVEEAKTWGKDMIQNFIDGITAKWEALKNKVSSVAQTVKNYLGFSEPKLGPLSNFHTYAPDMMDLFAKGIRDNEDVVTNQIEKSFDFGERTMKFGAEYGDGFGITKSSGMAYGSSSIGNITINIDGAKYSDEQSLAEAIAEAIQGMTDRRAAVYA